MPTLTTLASFAGSTGERLYGGLLADAQGNLYGVTANAGVNGDGTIFELARDATSQSGYSSTPIVLASFNGANGGFPYKVTLLADAQGNLYGTTRSGGQNGDGTIFELARDAATQTGFSSAPTVLASFDRAANGAYFPLAGLVADSDGNLYGTTQTGGASQGGTVFKLSHDATSLTGFNPTPTVLASLTSSTGTNPYGALVADNQGNLFGTALFGGSSNEGTVFELVRDPSSPTGFNSTPTVLASLDSATGDRLYDTLLVDAQGNIFGTAFSDGANGDGTIFEIKRDATTLTGYSAAPTVLVSFDNTGNSSRAPVAGLIADADGNLFGTSYNGGANGEGTVFELARDATSVTGYSTTTTTLGTFGNADGTFPYAELITDAQGNLYGTTSTGGPGDEGTVFQVSDSGFVVAPPTPPVVPPPSTPSPSGPTAGDDNLTGNPFPDTLRLLAGNDTYSGRAGNDLIYGNQGDDLVYGNMGADRLYGGQDNDRLYGGQDNDTLYGNKGEDTLHGNRGDDIVYGNQGSDIIYGNQDRDVLYGGQGDDRLYGGQGDDTLVGGLGNDTLQGGVGADRYVFGQGSGADLILGYSQADGDSLDFQGQTFTTADDGNGGTNYTLSGGGTVDVAGLAFQQNGPVA